MTKTEAIIAEGEKNKNSTTQSPVSGKSGFSTDVMGTLSGSSSNDKKVEGEDPATVHTSSSLQPTTMPLASKGEESSGTISPPKSSITAPQLKMGGGGGGGFGSAIIGSAQNNAFSSLAGIHGGDGKWTGNIKSDTISREQELWGSLTQVNSPSELGTSSINVEEKGNNATSRKLLLLSVCLPSWGRVVVLCDDESC